MRLTSVSLVLMLSLGASTFPQLASAQERKGMWFAAGVGYNSVAFDCANCDEPVTDLAPYIKVGWTLHPQILIGLEISVWSHDLTIGTDPQETSTPTGFINRSLTLTVYPKNSLNLFMKGGVGYQTSSVPCPTFACLRENDNAPYLGAEGVSAGTLHATVGYDIRLGPRIALTPSLDYTSVATADWSSSRYGQVNRSRQNAIAARIGITLP